MWTISVSRLILFLGLAFALPAMGLVPGTARAALEIDITKGNVDPLPVAIPDFFGADPAAADQGQRMAAVITANLNRSGLFKALDQKSFIQTPESLQARPRFADWRVLNAQALVSGKVGVESDGRLRVEFRLWDVLAGEQMTGLVISVQDQGVGMAPEDIPKAMTPFGQTESGMHAGGTGLGLPLVREMMTLHDGTLEISSVKGEGTIASLCFPLAQVETRRLRQS